MFGKNATEKVDHGDGSRLYVQEVFGTIQGEGPHAGRRATFIRFWGCHLRCYFCDTDFTSNKEVMTVEQLVAKCEELGNELVVLTGGEPMRQNIAPLIMALLAHRPRAQRWFEVQIETAGSFWFMDQYSDTMKNAIWDERLSLVVSPKTPAVHGQVREMATAWKYIVSAGQGMDAEDGLPVVNFQEVGGDVRRLARPSLRTEVEVYVQPMDEGTLARNNANVARCVRLVKERGYRLSLQQHKIVGVP